jgi:hypothetical protein
MVSKKILGAAIAAALLAQGASAAILLDTGTAKVTYAKDALLTGDVTSGYASVLGDAVLNVTGKVGSGVSSGNQIYIRIDLTNAKFKTAVASGDFSIAGVGAAALITVQSGGAVDSTSVIFQVTAPVAGVDQADTWTLDLDDASGGVGGLKISTSADVAIKAVAYDSASAAVNQVAANKLYTSARTDNQIVWGNSFKTTVTATNAVASVSNSFTDYVTSGAFAKLGAYKVEFDNTMLKPSTSAAVVLADLVTLATSSIKLNGDISFGLFGVSTTGTCGVLAGANQFVGSPVAGTAPFNTLSLAALNGLAAIVAGGTTYTICSDDTAAVAINEGSYSLDATYAGATAYAAPASSTGNALGTITRDGTSIYVPYLTTFADYTQRLVLVNRGSTAAPYKITFTTEAGNSVGVVSGSLVNGTIPAKTTLILPVRQDTAVAAGLIDSAASTKTRTAATIVVTAQPANIDAATTTVNSGDKATDTVKLK